MENHHIITYHNNLFKNSKPPPLLRCPCSAPRPSQDPAAPLELLERRHAGAARAGVRVAGAEQGLGVLEEKGLGLVF